MRILLLSFITVLSLTFCRETAAKDQAIIDETKLYKATTVDECIEEKECVWYHLLLATQKNINLKEISNNIALSKWTDNDNVRIRIIGKEVELPKEKYENYINQISPYFPPDISINKQFNFVIVETDDIEKELNGEFKEIALRTLAKDKKLQKNGIIKVDKKAQCYNFYYVSDQKPKPIFGYFSFIKRGSQKDMESCLKEMIYEGSGLSSIYESPLYKDQRFLSKYSNLELFILYLFYNDNIKPDMSAKELKQAFDKIYQPSLDYFKKQKNMQP